MKHWLQLVAIPNGPESFNKQDITDLKKNVLQHWKTNEHFHVLLAGSHKRRLRPVIPHTLPAPASSSTPAPPTPKGRGKGNNKGGKGKGKKSSKGKGSGGSGPKTFADIMKSSTEDKAWLHQKFHAKEVCYDFQKKNCRHSPRRLYVGARVRGVWWQQARTTSAIVWQTVSSTTGRQLLCQLIPRRDRHSSIWAWRLLLL